MRIFFATDVHGSEVCWRKFLNAGDVPQGRRPDHGRRHDRQGHGPDRGHDGGWEVTLQDQRPRSTTEDELRAMEKRISDRGYYPVRLTRDELTAWAADSTLVDARFKAEMLAAVERWMALADERLAGTGIRASSSRPRTTTCSRSTRSSTRPSIVELGEANTIALDGFTLVSTGWANRRRGTPTASCRSPSCGSASTGWWHRCPIRTARSSTSTRRRTARTSTMPQNSMPT